MGGPWASDQSEPTCEQLRQMWRQSKRHSRAAETTNEIPQYSDPFARASLDAYAAQILRPRPERRPVVYGRVQQSPPDKSLRPFDVLRRLNGRPIIKSDTVDPDDAAVLFSEEDKSPFVKATAKGSLQNLRDFVREEQGSLSASKGGFQNLRELIREEKLQGDAKTEWSDADIGRVVTSPSEHKMALYGMQSDAPYEMPQSSRRLNRLQMFRGPGGVGKMYGRRRGSAPHSKMRESRDQIDDLLLQLRADEARKPFPRTDPRGRKGSLRSSSVRNRQHLRQMDTEDSDDVYVIKDGKHRQDSQPFYVSSKFRRQNLLQPQEDEGEEEDRSRVECGVLDGQRCLTHSDCYCAGLQRCGRGKCLPKRNRFPKIRDEWQDETGNQDGLDSWIERRDISERMEDLVNLEDKIADLEAKENEEIEEEAIGE